MQLWKTRATAILPVDDRRQAKATSRMNFGGPGSDDPGTVVGCLDAYQLSLW
jgi:hypothetical protein